MNDDFDDEELEATPPSEWERRGYLDEPTGTDVVEADKSRFYQLCKRHGWTPPKGFARTINKSKKEK